MSTNWNIGWTLAMLGLLLASALPASPITSGIRFVVVGGLVAAIEWLARGEASRQVAWPRWLSTSSKSPR